jgi:PPOX class probable F420-dependent enzyme
MTDPALTVDRAISDDLREWLLAETRTPVLAVIAPDGTPSQSVMWFDLDPDDPDVIVMNTRRGRAKERWLRRDARVSVCFEEGWTWYAMRGTAELDDDVERSLAVIKGLARRYGADPELFNGQERVTLRIRVEKVISHE